LSGGERGILRRRGHNMDYRLGGTNNFILPFPPGLAILDEVKSKFTKIMDFLEFENKSKGKGPI
jgi:hypothetical protein